jgi:hypothetical protein
LVWLVLEDGHFLLNLHIYDSHNRLVLQITDNELVLNVHSWDIELVGTRLIIREAARDILFDITFRPPSTAIVKRGRFLRNGVELLAVPQWAALLNNRMLFQRVLIRNCSAGLVIGEDAHPPPAVFRIEGVPREGWDRAAAVRWARETAETSAATAAALNELLSSETLD